MRIAATVVVDVQGQIRHALAAPLDDHVAPTVPASGRPTSALNCWSRASYAAATFSGAVRSPSAAKYAFHRGSHPSPYASGRFPCPDVGPVRSWALWPGAEYVLYTCAEKC